MNKKSKSNWEKTKDKSIYHFDKNIIDGRWDTVIGLGHIVSSWDAALKKVIKEAKPATWRTRGYSEQHDVSPDIAIEEYDLKQAGASEELTICHMSWQFPKVFQKIADLFCLEDSYVRIHTHLTGDVFTTHIDKLEKWCPDDPSRVKRFIVNLTDWEPGQFSQFGNFNYSHWRAGDVATFDWANVPHSAANASLHPRVILLVTGIATENTYKFLNKLKSIKEYNV